MSLFKKDFVQVFVNHLVDLEKTGLKLNQFDSKSLAKEISIQNKFLTDLSNLQSKHAKKLLPLVEQLYNELQQIISNKIEDSNSIHKRAEMISELLSQEEHEFLNNLVTIIFEEQKQSMRANDWEDFLKIVKYFKTQDADYAFRRSRSIGYPLRIQQLIAVHKTNAFPENGIIKTTGQYSKGQPRESIHFTLNGPQKDLGLFNVKINKYQIGIIVPLVLIKDRIVQLHDNDTFVIGQLTLPKGSEIICRQDDYNGQHAGNAKLIFCSDSEDINDAIEKRILERGYSTVIQGQWGWSKFKDESDKKELVAAYEDLPYSDPNREVLRRIIGDDSWSGEFKQPFDSLATDMGISPSLRNQQHHEYTLFGNLELLYLDAYNNLNKTTYVDTTKLNNLLKEIIKSTNQLNILKKKYPMKESLDGFNRLLEILTKLKNDLETKKKQTIIYKKAIRRIENSRR